MAVKVFTRESHYTHSTGTKWIVDERGNLVVMATGKAIGIYAIGDWTSAEVVS